MPLTGTDRVFIMGPPLREETTSPVRMNRTPSLGGTLKLVQLFLVVLVVGFQRDCLTNSFLFRSRRGTSIRILVYDGQGFWLAQKRLSKGRFQWWPTGKQPARVLEAHQAQLLLQVTAKETVPHA